MKNFIDKLMITIFCLVALMALGAIAYNRSHVTFCAEKRWVNDYTEKYYIVECPDETPKPR